MSGQRANYRELLSKTHEVQLFERNAYFGGHSNTVSIEGAGAVHLDTGFVVDVASTYPLPKG